MKDIKETNSSPEAPDGVRPGSGRTASGAPETAPCPPRAQEVELPDGAAPL